MLYDAADQRGQEMYNRILLAYDGSVEGRTALREGALLAKHCGATVFLLSVVGDASAFLAPEVGFAGLSVRVEDDFTEILDEGVARLKKLGFEPVAKLVRGQPAEEISLISVEVIQIGGNLPQPRRQGRLPKSRHAACRQK
jgi:nucleotide-binding universal stress UspA family protein